VLNALNEVETVTDDTTPRSPMFYPPERYCLGHYFTMDISGLDKSLVMIQMLSPVVRFPLLQDSILSNSFVRRGDF
jgi:hypothetical protein